MCKQDGSVYPPCTDCDTERLASEPSFDAGMKSVIRRQVGCGVLPRRKSQPRGPFARLEALRRREPSTRTGPLKAKEMTPADVGG